MHSTGGCRHLGCFLGLAGTPTGGQRDRFLQGLRVVFLLVLTVALAGCDDFFAFAIENHRDEEVVVRLTGDREWQVGPCSVQIHPAISGPPYQDVEVQVETMDGETIRTASFPPKWHGRGVIRLQIEPDGLDTCPQPIVGTYMLVVTNYTRGEVTVRLDKTQIGVVAGVSTETFGPLVGTWETTANLRVYDSKGRELMRGITIDYDLGEVPVFSIGIRPQ